MWSRLALLLLFSPGCANPAAQPSAASAPAAAATAAARAERVDGSRARALVQAGALLLDVRTPQEFAGGHLEGAVNVPYDELERRAAELGSREKPVVLYCRSGRRSAIGMATLVRLGFQEVYDLGPMDAWR